MRTSLECQKRDERIHELGKWDRFRVNRVKVIDEYIAARKLQTIAEHYAKHCKIRQVLISINGVYGEEKRQTLIKLKGRFMSLVIAQVWRKRSKRWCAQPDDYSELYRNRSRRTFAVSLQPVRDSLYQRSLEKLKVFLIDNS